MTTNDLRSAEIAFEKWWKEIGESVSKKLAWQIWMCGSIDAINDAIEIIREEKA